MKVLIVYWHPEPLSFNASMFGTACDTLSQAGHEVLTSDLHAMAFDPVSSRKNFSTIKEPSFLKLQAEEAYATAMHGFSEEIETELQKLEWCDLMVWQFPLWWFGLPAALKGWVDRVFAMQRTYGGGHIYQTGLFTGRRALLSLTTGGPEEAYRKGGFNGDILGVLRPVHRGILQFVGFDVLAPHVVYGPAHLTPEQRQGALELYASRLLLISSEAPIDVGLY